MSFLGGKLKPREHPIKIGSTVDCKSGGAVVASGHVISFDDSVMRINVTWSITGVYSVGMDYTVKRRDIWQVVREDAW